MKDTLIGAVVLLIAAVYFLHGTARIVAVGLILFGVVTSIYETKRSKNTDDNHHLKGDEIEEDDMVEDAGKMEDEEETVDDEEIDEEVETIEKDDETEDDEEIEITDSERSHYESEKNTAESNVTKNNKESNTRANKPKKDISKPITVVIIVLALILGLSKCANSNNRSDKVTKQEEKTTETKKKKKEKTFKEFENTSLKDSFQALKDTGYKITYRYKTTDYDCTSEYENLSNDSEWLGGWIITSIENVDNDNKSFTVYIQTQDSIDAEAQRKANAKALTAKLEEVAAWEAVQKYGLTQYSKFKVHYMTGKLANEPKDENTWFLKAYVTYRNELGNKIETTCEAEVTGTTNAPQVTYFHVYE